MSINEVVAVFIRLTEGFLINVELFVFTLIFAIPLGFLVTFGSMNGWVLFSFKSKNKVKSFKPLASLVRFFVWIIRGTPLLLQILIIYLGPGLLGFQSPWPPGSSGRLVAAIVAFSINYACYFSEVYRGGLEGIPKGQTEAAQVLGMNPVQIFFKVKLVQLFKRIMPPMGNEVITLVKDTALANYISNVEILMTAREYASSGIIWPLFSTAIYFLLFVGLLTILFSKIEKKLDYFKI